MTELCDFIIFLLTYRELDFIIVFFKQNLFLLHFMFKWQIFFPTKWSQIPPSLFTSLSPSFPHCTGYLFWDHLVSLAGFCSRCSWAWAFLAIVLSWLHFPMLGLQEDRIWSCNTGLPGVCDPPGPASLMLELQACAIPIILLMKRTLTVIIFQSI